MASIARVLDPLPRVQTRLAPRVLGGAVALPGHRYDQASLARAAAAVMPGMQSREGLLERFFARVGVRHRHLALPTERYGELSGFGARNDAWIEVATELGERCLAQLVDDAGIAHADIDQLTTTTVTGLAVPSLDARLMNRLPLSPHLTRVPLFGLGCLGGAAGVARTADYLRAHPRNLAVLLAVELCSLTLQHADFSVANAISSGLFGDGAAAVLLAGAEHPLAARARVAGPSRSAGPTVLASRSVFFPDTERVMGWDIVDEGFQVVLSPDVPKLVREALPLAVDAFLAEHGLCRDDIATWVSHPGGPAVLQAMEEGLTLPEGALDASRESLAEVGNLSSASVLCVLEEFRANRRPPAGSYGLLMALGPAFCAEMVLLRW